MKAAAKRLVGRSIGRDLLEKLTEYAIAEREPSVSLAGAERIRPAGRGWTAQIERGREQLWDRTLARLAAEDVLLLEFGVFRGESMRYLVDHICSPGSLFYGFDSFEGLPEDWRGTAAAHFDQGGRCPDIPDPRVRFVKGWFRDTLPQRLDELAAAAKGRALVVHFDADLYSSTLYLLFTLAARFPRYTFIFDEFSGHETRALFNFLQATGATARFHYRLDWEGCPQVVSGELGPG